MSIPIYWVSYKDEGDINRVPRLVKKVSRMEKSLPNKQHIVKISNLNQKEGHIKTIQEAIKNNEKQIIIIDDKTSIINISGLKELIKDFWVHDLPILHLGGYMEEKIYVHKGEDTLGNDWVLGRTRSCFAYWLNLEKYKNGCISHWIESLDTEFGDIIYNNTFAIHYPVLITPYGYNIDTGLMNDTLKDLSIVQFNENEMDLTLRFKNISDDKLPRITLLTIVTDQRLWWPLIRLNLDNINYPSKKMKWIIVDIFNKNYDMIEDLLPRKRGHPGGWELEYLQKEWNNLSFNQIVNNLEYENKLVGDFVVEFDPQVYYPAFSVLSRVKTLIKYPSIKYAGCNQIQLYDIPNDNSILISKENSKEKNEIDFFIGSRICKREKNINLYNLENSIRIPSQFVSYLLNLPIKFLEKYNLQNYKHNNYNKIDKFPDFLESEDFFADIVMIIDNMKKKYEKMKK
jgi:hypothetical protein